MKPHGAPLRTNPVTKLAPVWPAVDSSPVAAGAAVRRHDAPGKLGHVEDIAYAALFLASKEAGIVTGTTIIVDGGQIIGSGSIG